MSTHREEEEDVDHPYVLLSNKEAAYLSKKTDCKEDGQTKSNQVNITK